MKPDHISLADRFSARGCYWVSIALVLVKILALILILMSGVRNSFFKEFSDMYDYWLLTIDSAIWLSKNSVRQRSWSFCGIIQCFMTLVNVRKIYNTSILDMDFGYIILYSYFLKRIYHRNPQVGWKLHIRLHMILKFWG